MSRDLSLYWAEVVIFAILLSPSLYLLFKHGKHGILGWLAVQSFCVVRVVGSALAIHDLNKNGYLSEAAVIVSSLGLAPLLLAMIGLLHEARVARIHRLRGWREWFLFAQLHAATVVGIILIVTHGSALMSRHRSHTAQVLIDVGFGILVACWLFLSMWAVLSCRPRPKYEASVAAFEDGTKLLYAVLLSAALTGIVVIYATICYTSNSTTAMDSFPLKVCLSVLPEMLVIVILIVAGLMTRDLKWKIGKDKLDPSNAVSEPMLNAREFGA